MAKIKGQTFGPVEIDLEANEYEDCVFNESRLFLKGAGRALIKNCQFNKCSISFGEAAQNTIDCLSLLYQSSDEALKGLIDSLFRGVREGRFPLSGNLPRP